MALAGVIVILMIWGIIWVRDKLTPPAPPMSDEELKEHCLRVISAQSPSKARAIAQMSARERRRK